MLRSMTNYSSQSKFDELIDQIVKEARDRLVLIVELENGFFGFELRSLQEFFAAAHLSDTARDTTQRYNRFEAIARPPHWRNVALLFAGRVGRLYAGEAANIIEICREIDRSEPDKYLKTGAWLGLEIAADRCFVPNRNFQRSIIEYSLTLLDDDFIDRKTTLVDALRRLQLEDITDHVKPVVEDKLLRARFSSAGLISEVYYNLFGSIQPLLEFLDTYLSSNNSEEVNWALEKSLEYKIPANWLSRRIGKIVSNLPPSTFSDIFGIPAFVRPAYVRACLQETKLDSKKITALSTRITQASFPRHSIGSESPVEESIVLTAENRLWNEVYTIRILSFLYEKLMEGSGRSGYYIYRGQEAVRLSPSTWVIVTDLMSKESKKCL